MSSEPSSSAAADYTATGSLPPPPPSASSPPTVHSEVREGFGIQFGQPVRIAFLRYKQNDDILEALSGTVSSIVSRWKELLEGPELSFRRTLSENDYSARDWDSAVRDAVKMGEKNTKTQLKENAYDYGISKNSIFNLTPEGQEAPIHPSPDEITVSLGYSGPRLRRVDAKGEWSVVPCALVMKKSKHNGDEPRELESYTSIEVGLVGVATDRIAELTADKLNVIRSQMGWATPHRSLAGKDTLASLTQSLKISAGETSSSNYERLGDD
ncbi:LOW QUALITY PROTEIN: hypothetical protein JCM24511_02395 [Saitozyma sp. JCM 24511]|nr:LOW QUALITY PROTEIN: hypothetical protein JCM24511_02395 [Saitozyma sp. JCM 24511]